MKEKSQILDFIKYPTFLDSGL